MQCICAERHPTQARGTRQKWLRAAHFRMGVRTVLRSHASPLPVLPFQHANAFVSQCEHLGILHLFNTMFIPYLSLVYTIPAGHCAHCAPISFCLGRPRPQIFFTCYSRPTDGRQPKAFHTYGEDDIRVALVFYSTFENLDLPGSGPMGKLDVPKYYYTHQRPPSTWAKSRMCWVACP